MARRRKKTTSRRRFTGINLLNAAEAYALTSVWTQAAFNTNPIEFVTGVYNHPKHGATYNPGGDGGHVITLPELIGLRKGGHTGSFGGNYGTYASGFTDAVAKNLGGIQGLIMPAVQSAGITIGFKLANRLTRRPRSMGNKMLKQLGVGGMVRI